MITWENYEEYMVMHADGELKPDEVNELIAFVAAHPELKKEMDLYSMLQLTPDTTVVFEHKDALLKKEGGARIIAFPNWRQYGVAAGVAAILLISFFKFTEFRHYDRLAKNNKADTAKQVIAAPVHNDIIAVPQDQVAGSDTIAKATVAPQSNVAVNTPAISNNKGRDNNSNNNNNKEKEQDETPLPDPVKPMYQPLVKNSNDEIEKIDPSKVKELRGQGTVVAVPVVPEPAAPPIAANTEAEDKSFFDRLPIDDLKKQGMENVATAVAKGLDRISAVKQQIEDGSISVKIKRRRLVISF